MRLVWQCVLLAGVMVAGSAVAQVGEGVTSFEVEPLDGPLPATTEVVRAYTAQVFCEPPLPTARAPELHVWRVDAPAWLQVVLEPSVHVLDGCAGAQTIQGSVKLSASDQAPATTPATLTLGIAYEDGLRNRTRETRLPVTVAYFSILDVQLPQAIAVAEPGSSHTYHVKLTSFGNGRTNVTFHMVSVADGLRVDPIAPFTLGSKQAGESDISRDVEIVVHAAEGAGYLNEVGVVNIDISSAYALDGTPGDTSSVSLLLTTRGLATPGTPWVALLALALLARVLRPARS